MKNRLKLLLALHLLSNSTLAHSFPDMVRHGYQTCNSCHVSPSGGGVLNGYGRAVSSELLSTYRNERLSRYFLRELPSWFNFGGDVRYVNVTANSRSFKYHRHFLMQSSFELAVSPVPGLTLASEIGFYNVNFPEKNTRKIEAEQRRNYVLLSLPKNLSLRAGRYTIPFGINYPDHTLATKQSLGLGQGSETFNTEIIYQSKFFEMFFTGAHGNSGQIVGNDAKGYAYSKSSGRSGVAAKISAFPSRGTTIGLSFFRLSSRETKRVQTAYGLNGTFSIFSPIYTQFELDQLIETGKKRDTIWVVRQGAELYRGVSILATYEGVRSQYSAWRYQLQLFPISHLELSAEYKRQVPYPKGQKTEAFVFLLHYYL